MKMKTEYKYMHWVAFLLAFGMLTVFQTQLIGKPEAKKERTRMKLYYAKSPDGTKKITIAITAGSGRNMHGVADAEVVLNSMVNDSTIELARLKTDTLGTIELFVEADYKFPVNEEGKTYLEAIYEGNDVYRNASNDIEIADVDFEFSFDIEDSVKYLTVVATQKDPDGNTIPVEELDISIGVQRLYSVLTIESIETDEDGVAVLEFPDDIPGDADGLLTIRARIEDDDDFGTVEQFGEVQWGVPVSYAVEPLPRQLYTDEAPLWMIASVFIILLGAWYHFGLSIYKLRKIKGAPDK
jgi:hypothetical protein